MAEDEEQKTTRKSAPKKAEPVVIDQALSDAFWAAVDAFRQQLRSGEALVLPGMLERALPPDLNKGDRAKVIDWRAWVVWAEWTGNDWDLIVYQDGKLRE